MASLRICMPLWLLSEVKFVVAVVVLWVGLGWQWLLCLISTIVTLILVDFFWQSWYSILGHPVLFLAALQDCWFNTSLAAPGALAHRLQWRTACKIQNAARGPHNGRRGLKRCLDFWASKATFATGWSILTVRSNHALKIEKKSLSLKATLFFKPKHREFLIFSFHKIQQSFSNY